MHLTLYIINIGCSCYNMVDHIITIDHRKSRRLFTFLELIIGEITLYNERHLLENIKRLYLEGE